MVEVELDWNLVARSQGIDALAPAGAWVPAGVVVELLLACCEAADALSTVLLRDVRLVARTRRDDAAVLHVRYWEDSGALFVASGDAASRGDKELLALGVADPHASVDAHPPPDWTGSLAVQAGPLLSLPSDSPAVRAIASVAQSNHGLRASFDAVSLAELAGRDDMVRPAVIEALVALTLSLATRNGVPADRLVSIGQLVVTWPRGALPADMVVVLVESTGRFDAWISALNGRTLLQARDVWVGGERDQAAARREASSELLRDAAASALGLPEIGSVQDLADRGATSLDLSRLRLALIERTGWAPPLADLRPEAEHGASYAAPRPPQAGDAGREIAVEWADAERSGAVTHAEQRLWLLEKHASVSPAYNEVVAWDVPGEPDEASLARALSAFVARHDVLTTTFVADERRVVRRAVGTAAAPALEVLARAPNGDAGLRETIRAFVRRPFDLEHGPFLRLGLLRVSARRSLLMLCCHHIACDEWSLLAIARRELPRLYADPQAHLPMASSMAELAGWERTPARERAATEASAAWAEALRAFPLVLALPEDFFRPARSAHGGAAAVVRLSPELAGSVRALARAAAVTPFCVLLTAFAAVIQRLSGQARFLIGVPVTTREDVVDQSVFGCLVNTLPIPFEVGPRDTFDRLMCACSERIRFAMAHKHAPFDRIAAALPCERAANRGVLVQVAFSYHEPDGTDLQLGELHALPFAVDNGCSKFDLMLEVQAREDGLYLRCEYDDALFDPRAVDAALRAYERTLARCTKAPDAPLSGGWLGEGALELAGSAREVAATRTRAAVLGRLASLQRAPALIAGASTCSYAELQAAVVRAAAALERHIDPAEQLIGVHADRGIGWVVAVLAVLRVGCGYLPLARSSPPAQLLRVLARAAVRTVFVVGPPPEWGAQYPGTLLLEDALEAESSPAEPPVREPRGEAFYAISTSGSTGEPRVAAVHWAGFSNLVDWYVRELSLCERDVVLVATSVAFDLTQKNVFAALAVGARLVLDVAPVFDAQALLGAIEEHAITVVNCTPSVFAVILALAEPEEFRALRSLRVVVLGGEPLNDARLRHWLARPGTRARVMNSYGPTECTDVVAAHWVAPDEIGAASPVPIGLPIQNARLAVIGADGSPVPRGSIGELVVYGLPVGLGYIGAGVGATGYGDAPERSYRTGDLARVDWRGRLLFLGRADGQRKLRGLRIDLDEIEARIRARCHRLREVAVAVHGEPSPAAALCAYYVADEVQEPTALSAALVSELPAYMMPTHWLRLEELPRSASLKVDRARLPPPPPPSPARGGTARETAVAERLGAALGVASLGLDDDFFAAGGNSLLAVLAVEQLRSIGLSCSVQDLIERRTPRALSAAVSADQPASKPGA